MSSPGLCRSLKDSALRAIRGDVVGLVLRRKITYGATFIDSSWFLRRKGLL